MGIAVNYSPDKLRRDFVAALTVGAISLPQGMAYALLAGVDPKFGLYSAIVVTFVASVFGSSSQLVNGPTSAISLVIFSALSIFDPEQRVEAAGRSGGGDGLARRHGRWPSNLHRRPQAR
jgi:SulP family sulfate permease